MKYRVTKVLGYTDYVDIKMRVAFSVLSLHLSGPTAQISSSSQQNLCPRVLLSPCGVTLSELLGSLKLVNVRVFCSYLCITVAMR